MIKIKQRLKIYKIMLHIFEQMVLLDESEDKEHLIIINKKSFKLIKDPYGDIYIKRIRKSNISIVFGYCSLLKFLVDFKIYGFLKNTYLTNLPELYAARPISVKYLYSRDDIKSRINLLQLVINSIENDVTHT